MGVHGNVGAACVHGAHEAAECGNALGEIYDDGAAYGACAKQGGADAAGDCLQLGIGNAAPFVFYSDFVAALCGGDIKQAYCGVHSLITSFPLEFYL